MVSSQNTPPTRSSPRNKKAATPQKAKSPQQNKNKSPQPKNKTPEKSKATPSKTTNNKATNKSTPTKEKSKTNKRTRKEKIDNVDSLDDPSTTIFAACQGKGALIVTVDDWIERYKEDQIEAARELIEFVIQSSGWNDSIDPTAFEEGELETTIHSLEEKEEGSAEPPLTSKKSEFKHFKAAFLEFWDKLISQCQRSIIYDGYLIETTVTWLSALSSSKHRSLRFTSTLAAYQIVSSLVQVVMEQRKEKATAERQHNSEKEKRDKKTHNETKVQQLSKKIENINQRIETIQTSMINLVFDQVFSHRYRDSTPEIRGSSISSLGEWITEDPTYFLTDQYMKYLGWTLNDKVVDVRFASVSALRLIYSNPDAIEHLELFTKKFLPRMIEIAEEDKEVTVQVEGIKLCTAISNVGGFTQADTEKIFRLIGSDNPHVRLACGNFVYEKLLKDGDEETKRTAKHKKETLIKQQFTTIVEFWLESSPLPNMPEYVVDALYPLTEIFKDLENMTNLLLSEDEEFSLSDRHQTVLIKILVASVKKALFVQPDLGIVRAEGENSNTQKLTQKQEKQLADAKEKITFHFIPMLPLLISKYQSDEAKLDELLTLPPLLNLETYISGHLNEFSELLTQLTDERKGILFTHSNQGVLEGVSKTLKCFLSSEVSALSQDASKTLRKILPILEDKLNTCLEKRGEEENKEEEERNNYELGLAIKRIYAIALQNNLPADTFESLYQLVGPILDSATLESQILVNCIGFVALYVMWSYYSIGTNPTAKGIANLKRVRDTVFGQLETLLSHPKLAVSEKAYLVLLDLLILFSSTLTSIPALSSLSYEASPSLQEKIFKFYETTINKMLELRKQISGEGEDKIEEASENEDDEEEKEEEEKKAKAKKSKKNAKTKGKQKVTEENNTVEKEIESIDEADTRITNIISTICRAIRYGGLNHMESGVVLGLLGRSNQLEKICVDLTTKLLNIIRTKDKDNEWVIVHDALRKQYLRTEKQVEEKKDKKGKKKGKSKGNDDDEEEEIEVIELVDVEKEKQYFRDLAHRLALSYAFNTKLKEGLARLIHEGALFSLGKDPSHEGLHLSFLTGLELLVGRLQKFEASVVLSKIIATVDSMEESEVVQADESYTSFISHLEKIAQNTVGPSTPTSTRKQNPPGSVLNSTKKKVGGSAKKAARRLELDFEPVGKKTATPKKDTPKKPSEKRKPSKAKTVENETEDENENEEIEQSDVEMEENDKENVEKEKNTSNSKKKANEDNKKSTQEAPKTPKTRGRPPKTPSKIVEEEKEDEGENEIDVEMSKETPKKRGRPSKTPSKPKPVENEEEEEEEEEVPLTRKGKTAAKPPLPTPTQRTPRRAKSEAEQKMQDISTPTNNKANTRKAATPTVEGEENQLSKRSKRK